MTDDRDRLRPSRSAHESQGASPGPGRSSTAHLPPSADAVARALQGERHGSETTAPTGEVAPRSDAATAFGIPGGSGAVLRRGRPLSELGAAPARPARALQMKSSGGSPLDADLRAQWEPQLGTDLSGVRVHADSDAAADCEQMNAEAYTRDQNIYLGAGPSGRELLAHEVAHTVQNARGETSALDGLGGSAAARSSLEASADRVAADLTSAPARPAPAAAPRAAPATRAIQRKARPIQRRGLPVSGGATEMRQFVGTLNTEAVLGAIQLAAERRQGHPTFGGEERPNIRTNGIGSAIEQFLTDSVRVRAGQFTSEWADDNGSDRAFAAWDYQMQVRMWIGYEGQDQPTAVGVRESTSTIESAGSAGTSMSRSDGTSASVGVEAGAEAGEGGHEGAPGGKITGGGSAGLGVTSGRERGSQAGETSGGSETFAHEDPTQRFEADLIANFTVDFRPAGSTFGMTNFNLRPQQFRGDTSFGRAIFDQADLRRTPAGTSAP